MFACLFGYFGVIACFHWLLMVPCLVVSSPRMKKSPRLRLNLRFCEGTHHFSQCLEGQMTPLVGGADHPIGNYHLLQESHYELYNYKSGIRLITSIYLEDHPS